MLVDTHAHLNFPDFQKDLNKVINRSIEKGVGKIICVSSNTGDSEKAIEIAKKYPGIVFAAVGIHPQQTDPGNSDSPEVQIKKLAELAKTKAVVAIGECGLDYTPAPPGEKDRPKEEQFLLFQEQIKLAIRLNKPIIIHSRKAFKDTVQTVQRVYPEREPASRRGVFHCYAAGKKGIETVNQLGFFIGIDGNLTYDEGLQSVAKEIPFEKILLETDCPFLSPQPFRNQQNEPANIKIIAQCLAKTKKTSLENITKITSKNSQLLFNFPY